MKHAVWVVGILGISLSSLSQTKQVENPAAWTIYIANDACSDYTFGFTESQTRKAFADLVRAHLDEMQKTDNESFENRDRYNMSVTQEADAFLEYYPERGKELIRRVREGRVAVGAEYNNALWGFQSTEGMIRTFYPARRLEKTWGIPMDVVEHMEHPALPWGTATLLAGSGFRWVSVPYYDFDSTFSGLTNPPLFRWAGPDGSTVGVRMDKFASDKAHYTEGEYLLNKPSRIGEEWIPHYAALSGYPVGPLLASGTHGDNNPTNGTRAAGFADGVIRYNGQTQPHARLVNATFPMFFRAVDALKLNLPVLSGDFGVSWDVWPVTLASYASKARLQEHAYLAAESLLALAPATSELTRRERESAEWNWIMMGDHAWNGTDDANRSVNAELRHKWSDEFERLQKDLTNKGWKAVGAIPDPSHITIFNPLSFKRNGLVSIEVPAGIDGIQWRGRPLASQVLEEDGRRMLYFVSPQIEAFGFGRAELAKAVPIGASSNMKATDAELENQWYRLAIDTKTGGIGSLIDKASGKELVVGGQGFTIGQSTFFDGKQHALSGVTSDLVAAGPVLARIKVSGVMDGIQVVNYVTLYNDLNRIDLEIQIHKPVTKGEQRLTQSFPVLTSDAEERLEAVGAVIRPQPQPAGDLLPGADTRRFAVQGFVDAARKDGPGVTVVPQEAFFLRKDLAGITFEALGNDQDYAEQSHDQNGVTDFRFRYSLRSHPVGYDNAETVAWSHTITNTLLVTQGRMVRLPPARVAVDSRRAIAIAFKPSEEQGSLVRIWETAGRSGSLDVSVKGFHRAILTDLLERPIKPLLIQKGKVSVELKASGFAALQLLP